MIGFFFFVVVLVGWFVIRGSILVVGFIIKRVGIGIPVGRDEDRR